MGFDKKRPPPASWLRHLGQCGEMVDEFDLLVFKVRIRCPEDVIQPTRLLCEGSAYMYVTPPKKNMPTFLNFLII